MNGNTIEIGGFQGTSHGEGFEEWIKNPLEEFEASDHFKLLISHFPGLYYEGIKADVNADLAVAAHYHGGLIRLPIFGGLYHPDDGFFRDIPAESIVWNMQHSLSAGDLEIMNGYRG